MRRIWGFVLLVSLGLNLGLVWSSLSRDTGYAGAVASRSIAEAGVSPVDSARWWDTMQRRLRGMSREMKLDGQHRQRFHQGRIDVLPLVRELRLEVIEARSRLHDACLKPELDPALATDQPHAHHAAFRSSIRSCDSIARLNDSEIIGGISAR